MNVGVLIVLIAIAVVFVGSLIHRKAKAVKVVSGGGSSGAAPSDGEQKME